MYFTPSLHVGLEIPTGLFPNVTDRTDCPSGVVAGVKIMPGLAAVDTHAGPGKAGGSVAPIAVQAEPPQ